MSDLTTEEIVKLYNPQNAAGLKPEQIEEMRTLTFDQIKALAKEYPNRTSRAYLYIVDTKSKIPIEKQLPSLSTWENLYNLIAKHNLKFVATGFRGQVKQTVRSSNVRPRRSVVVDLSDAELMDLPGFTLPRKNGGVEVIEPEVVQVKKVMKKETLENIEKAVTTQPVKRGRPKKS